MSSTLICPQCGSHDARRSRRRNVWERAISLLGYLPYRCRDCRTRFFRLGITPGALVLTVGALSVGVGLLAGLGWWLAAPGPSAPVVPPADTIGAERLQQEIRLLKLQQEELLSRLRRQKESLGSAPVAPAPATPAASAPAGRAPLGPSSAAPRPSVTPPRPGPLPSGRQAAAPRPLAGPELAKQIKRLEQRMLKLQIQLGMQMSIGARLWHQLREQGGLPAQGLDPVLRRQLMQPFASSQGMAAPRPLPPRPGQRSPAQQEHALRLYASRMKTRIALLQRQLKSQMAKNTLLRSYVAPGSPPRPPKS